MDDLTNGRINCGNITDGEWGILETISTDWQVPTPMQWAALINLLGLVDIRRGYSLVEDGAFKGEYYIQGGTAQIRLNEHGEKALEYHARGENYYHGTPNTYDDFRPHMSDFERSLME